jgi:hypothetical protein
LDLLLDTRLSAAAALHNLKLTLGLAATLPIAAGSNVGADCSMSKCRQKF